MGQYRRYVGIEDLHTHFRWRAIRGWVSPDAIRTLEVGANIGVMTVELAKQLRGTLVASEFDEALLGHARAAVAANGLLNVQLSQDDLRTLSAGTGFDQALMIDVLEHIDDHEKALDQLAAALKPGGRLIISVPTPNYPDVFGRVFHEEIGHVRDGYWLADLQALLSAAGFDVVRYRYYTGPVASWACSLWYQRAKSWRTKLALMPILRAVGIPVERFTREANAASVAVLAVRR